ncbi:MAG: helix-turn-helix domain-containing protein [Gammaproteobacteria bacterium]|nr:helix-turn-helix domain-containing protein [Gammaproteobacteria bacterium]
MNSPESMHEQNPQPDSYPGALLARARESKGLSQEYIAGKLHLRKRVIELLELDQYDDMPQAVFVQGYMRAYAKLLGLSPVSYLEQYNLIRGPEKKSGCLLRQKEKEPLYLMSKFKWLIVVAGIVVVLIGYDWWGHHEKRDVRLSAQTATEKVNQVGTQDDLKHSASSLIDLSTMESNLSLRSDLPASGSHDD